MNFRVKLNFPQVTPDEIKLKAKQMVELVRASQVIQTKKLPPTQGTSKPADQGGSGKTKKPKKMIRVAGGQVSCDWRSLWSRDPSAHL